MSDTTTAAETGTRGVPPVRRFDWGQPFVYLVALVIAAVAIGPVLYVFMGGLRTTGDLNADPAGLPDPWTLQNWITVLGAPRFWGNVFACTVPRSEERRVGKECVRTWRSWGAPVHKKKK